MLLVLELKLNFILGLMDNAYCTNCPMRLFNTKIYNVPGVGNPFSGRLIVLPYVDYQAYKQLGLDYSSQVEIITNILSTGVLENLYIVPLIRCNPTISCDINTDIYKLCVNYLINDINKYGFTDILLMGSACSRYLGVDTKDYISSLITHDGKCKYFVTYSPLTKYTNDKLFAVVTANVQQWYIASYEKNYSKYDIVMV